MMFAYLNASFSNDDDSLEVPGYNLFRADHPSNTKRGGVCIYYRNSLPLKISVFVIYKIASILR